MNFLKKYFLKKFTVLELKDEIFSRKTIELMVANFIAMERYEQKQKNDTKLAVEELICNIKKRRTK